MEQVWEQQREEDRTGQRIDIAVPPKYSGADFLKHSYWSNRGTLDAEWDGNPAEEFQSDLNLGRTERQLSESDLRAWRPEKKRGGRKKAAE